MEKINTDYIQLNTPMDPKDDTVYDPPKLTAVDKTIFVFLYGLCLAATAAAIAAMAYVIKI